jgi:hypothetical protein
MDLKLEGNYTKDMNNVLLIVAAIVLFSTALISPRMGGKIQRKANKKAGRLQRSADWLWDPIEWWAKKSIEFTRKCVVVVTAWGKKARRKLPF